MANLSTLACLTANGNTGKQACAFDPKNIVGVIITPKGYLVTQTKLATLLASLQADAQNASKANRIYPVWGFQTSQDNSEDIIVQTMGYGSKYVVREGYQDWKFDYVEGGLTMHKNVRKFNGNSHDFLFVDSKNTIIGTSAVDSTGQPALKAIPCDGGFFWAHPFKINDGSKISEYKLQFVFAPKFINEYLEYVAADFDVPSNVTGLVDVNLTSPSANATSGSYNVVAKTAGVATNLGDLYQTELASGGNWVATTAAGLVIPVLSATYNAAINGFVIALDKTSANYPTSGNVIISLAAPTVLAAANIVGYESGTVSIVKN